MKKLMCNLKIAFQFITTSETLYFHAHFSFLSIYQQELDPTVFICVYLTVI